MNINSLRKHRILNMAIFDYVATFIIVFILHYYMWKNPLKMKEPEKRTYTQYILSLVLLCITFVGLGTLAHYFAGIQSALSAYLGFNEMPSINR